MLAAFSFCLSASFLALRRFSYPLTGIDDANIYFVYARNLANGYGFVYNSGGERVEGFTSLLWTLISALAFKFLAHPELTLLIINILLVSVGIGQVLNYLQNDLWEEKSRGARVIWSVLYLIFIFTSPRYIVWNTITLMENALWSTLLLLTTIFVVRKELSTRAIHTRFLPLAILLLVTRPESILWVAVFALILFFRIAFRSNTVNALKTLAPPVISIILALTLLTLFRLYYFGYPLPNTYYAKVSPVFTYNIQQGMLYLSQYFVSDPIVMLCIIAVLAAAVQTMAVLFSKPGSAEGPSFLPIIAAVGLFAPLLTGGDHFGSFRVYQNIYSIELLCLFSVLNRVLLKYTELSKHSKMSPLKKSFSFGLTLILLISIVQSQFYMWNSIVPEMGIEFSVADYGRKNGEFIQKLFSPLSRLPSLGVVTSGGIKYSYAGEVIDLMGLNNIAMAHNAGSRVGIKDHAAFDIHTFYQLQPDIVWPVTVEENKWHYSDVAIQESWENNYGFKGLFDEPYFQELYTYAKVTSKTEQKYALVAWFKRDLLMSVMANGDFVVEEYKYTHTASTHPGNFMKLPSLAPSRTSRPSFRY